MEMAKRKVKFKRNKNRKQNLNKIVKFTKTKDRL